MTRKQSLVYYFIKQFIEDNKYSPSYREIMSSLDIKSTSEINGIMKALKFLGKIEYKEKLARSVEIKE